MDIIKKRLKKRQKEYEEIQKEIVPPFDPLEPKKGKKKRTNFLS